MKTTKRLYCVLMLIQAGLLIAKFAGGVEIHAFWLFSPAILAVGFFLCFYLLVVAVVLALDVADDLRRQRTERLINKVIKESEARDERHASNGKH